MTTDEILIWYEGLRSTTNDAFFPLFFDRSRYLILCGGGGSGKSIFAGRKILERVTNEAGHRWLVCRKVARTMRESVFRQLITQAETHCPASVIKINKSDNVITFANGSEIIFAGLDDPEKLKSIFGITGIWIEEASEISEADFNQLDIRLRGQTPFYKQIIVTFNPVSIRHWLKRRFFDSSDPRAKTHISTYLDNRFLDPEAKETLEGFRDSDEYYYTVYALGQWGVTGKSVFNSKAISKRLEALPPPEKVGYFEYSYDGFSITEVRFFEDCDGFVKIYSPPEPGVPYVIGADTAGEGSDSFVAQVIDNRDGRQVAILRRSFDEDIFARQLLCLGSYYNDALIAVEVNYSTYPIMELSRLGYPRQYVREVFDNFTGATRPSFGFRTDSATRPVIISGLIKAMREKIELVCDRTTLEEMLTFVRNDALRPEAEAGAHDDCVMALAIAHGVRGQQSYSATGEAKIAWTSDMLEDYDAADERQKAYLLSKWGEKNSGKETQ